MYLSLLSKHDEKVNRQINKNNRYMIIFHMFFYDDHEKKKKHTYMFDK